ncbi:hypothetical protein BT93_A1836 [Corymbia citriodora subsp. variegata]|nr:hypothetical protein BT93_A1836 [Corymbia citriodora subsp. variegata]
METWGRDGPVGIKLQKKSDSSKQKTTRNLLAATTRTNNIKARIYGCAQQEIHADPPIAGQMTREPIRQGEIKARQIHDQQRQGTTFDAPDLPQTNEPKGIESKRRNGHAFTGHTNQHMTPRRDDEETAAAWIRTCGSGRERGTANRARSLQRGNARTDGRTDGKRELRREAPGAKLEKPKGKRRQGVNMKDGETEEEQPAIER